MYMKMQKKDRRATTCEDYVESEREREREND